MSLVFIRCLVLISWLPFIAMARPIERHRVKTLPGPYLRFDRFTVKNELFKQAPFKRLQVHDSRGYLWFLSEHFGSSQLFRYDGTHSKVFGTDSLGYFGEGRRRGADEGRVMENEDREIWRATKNGLSYFNPVTETFQTFRNPYTIQQTIDYWIMGKGGQQWFTTLDSPDIRPIKPFFLFNSRTRKVRKITPTRLINGYTRQNELTQSIRFRPITVDKLGRVWGDVNAGASVVLGYYDPVMNRLVWYPLKALLDEKSGTSTGSLRDISDVWPDDRYVWVGGNSKQMGLWRFDLAASRWKQFLFSSIPYNRIFQIVQRNTNQLWLHTDSGLSLFDKTKEILFTYPDLVSKASISPDEGFILETAGYILKQHQSLWTGSDGENNATLRVIHEPQQYFTPTGDSLKNFTMLYKKGVNLYFSYHDARKNLVFAEYNESTHWLTSLYKTPLKAYVNQNFHFALRDSTHQTVWLIGNTNAGHIFRFDERTRRLSPIEATIHGLPYGENQPPTKKDFKKNHDLFSDHEDVWDINIQMIAQDRLGNIWFPTHGIHGGNLIKFDQKSKRFMEFKAGSHGLPIGSIRSIMVDQQGLLWLGYQNGLGIYLFDPKSNQAAFVLKINFREKIEMLGLTVNSSVTGLLDDPVRETIWIAQDPGGIWQFDRRTQTARRVCREPVFSGQYGSEFYLAKSGLLWFKNLKGLVQFNPQTGQLFYFGAPFDLTQNEHATWHLAKSEDDEFFINTFRFYDRAVRPDTTRPRVIFNYLKVFDRELLLSRSLNYTPELTLSYDQNFFTIGFALLSYFQSENNQYAYQLVGYNKNWVSSGTNSFATFTDVPHGQYTLQLRGRDYKGIWSTIRRIQILIHPPVWQTGWFRLLFFALLITAVVILYRFQIERRTLKAKLEVEEARRQQKEAEFNEKEAAYQLKLSQAEMATLRSQMNPHFLFNCLNSIQYFTAQNDAEKATNYLSKFSRLIRLVLENSKSDKVTLTNELETLRLYIEMEAMRFPQKLQYQIQTNHEIDTDEVLIPPLILQPFVENAIWHGLMHKDEGGMVKIKVEQLHGNLLHVEIIDNGVGRAKAAEYKSKSATRNKSFGMKITAERIELINQLYHLQTQVRVIDLLDDRGQALGTNVAVDIPI